MDRAAEGTEFIRSVIYVICKWIDWFESSRDVGRCYEDYLVHNVHTVHTIYAIHIMYNMHTVCIVHTVLIVYNTVQQMLDD